MAVLRAPALLVGTLLLMGCVPSRALSAFKGLATVAVTTSERIVDTNDISEGVETFLGQLLSGDISVPINGISVGNKVLLGHTVRALLEVQFAASFLALDDPDVIPTCLPDSPQQVNISVYMNASFEVFSVSLQNYHNTTLLGSHCIGEDSGLAYIIYHEHNCRFQNLECEPSYLHQTLRYDLLRRGSVLHTFYCFQGSGQSEELKESCLGFDVELQWNSSCALMFENTSLTLFKEWADLEEGRIETRIDTLPQDVFSPNCSFEVTLTRGGIPIIIADGDETWDLVPGWLKVALRVLSAVSLAASVFCLVTYVLFAELRNLHGKNVTCLLVALIASLLLTSGYFPLEDAVHHTPLCVFVATMTYYLVVVPNYWWTSVAIFLAWTLGRKGIHRMSEDSSGRFFLLLSLLGWGVPLVFTLVALILHVGGVRFFHTEDYCWLEQGWPTTVIVLQTLIPFLMDIALFGLVVHRLRMTRREMAALDMRTKSSSRDNRNLTIKMAAIFGILWLPAWISYILFLFVRVAGLAVTSQVLNQLTTVVLPLVLCCNRRVVRLWGQRLTLLKGRLYSSETRSTLQTPLHSLESSVSKPGPIDEQNKNGAHTPKRGPVGEQNTNGAHTPKPEPVGEQNTNGAHTPKPEPVGEQNTNGAHMPKSGPIDEQNTYGAHTPKPEPVGEQNINGAHTTDIQLNKIDIQSN